MEEALACWLRAQIKKLESEGAASPTQGVA
jgi:hypothetical protein